MKKLSNEINEVESPKTLVGTLTTEEVLEIKKLGKEGYPIKALAAKFRVEIGHIRYIMLKKELT